jgi:hypothetical protein
MEQLPSSEANIRLAIPHHVTTFLTAVLTTAHDTIPVLRMFALKHNFLNKLRALAGHCSNEPLDLSNLFSVQI